MHFNPVHLLRTLQFIFAFVVLGLDGYVAYWYNSSESELPCPPVFAFMVFSAVFTLLIVIPYTVIAPRWFPAVSNKWVMLGTEVVTSLFWFGGFIATADLLRKLAVCRGVVCNCARASAVFGVLEFVVFGCTAVFAIRHVFVDAGDDGRATRTIAMKQGWANKDAEQQRRWPGQS